MSVHLSIVQTCRVGLVFSVRMGEQSVLAGETVGRPGTEATTEVLLH